jgi:hypothetical protein
MRMEAIIQKTDSQMSSAEPQTSLARVYHTAMNAAPRHRQRKKPSNAPTHILFVSTFREADEGNHLFREALPQGQLIVSNSILDKGQKN